MRNALIGTIGFFIAAGAGGGIECGTMGWGKGLAYMALGFAIMSACALLNHRRAK